MGKRTVALTAAAGVVLSALSFTAAPASAAEIHFVDGTLSAPAPASKLAFCPTECISAGTLTPPRPIAFDPASGNFAGNAEAGSRVAVQFGSAASYLQVTPSGTYQLVSDFSAATTLDVAAGALGTLTVELPAQPPVSEPTPDPEPESPVADPATGKIILSKGGREETQSFVVAACASSCLDANGFIQFSQTEGVSASTSAGEFSISKELKASGTKLAVSFDDVNVSGYLAPQGENYHLVAFDKVNSNPLAVGSATSFRVEIPADPIVAPEPDRAKAQVMPYMLTRGGSYSGFRFDVTKAGPHSTVTVAFKGCGGGVVASKRDTRGGNRSIYIAPKGSLLGPSWTIHITVSEPGLADRREAWDTFGGPAGKFACAKTAPRNWVAKWSAKKGIAKVGKRVAVTATKLSAAGKRSHAKVKYSWHAGGKKVGTRSALTIPRALRGKVLVVKITVTKAGYRPLVKTLRFGKIR